MLHDRTIKCPDSYVIINDLLTLARPAFIAEQYVYHVPGQRHISLQPSFSLNDNADGSIRFSLNLMMPLSLYQQEGNLVNQPPVEHVVAGRQDDAQLIFLRNVSRKYRCYLPLLLSLIHI